MTRWEEEGGLSVVELLKWCSRRKDVVSGRVVHSEVVEMMMMMRFDGDGYGGDECGRGDGVVGGALIGMYARCGAVREARCVLDHLPSPRHLISWSALISAYSQHGHGHQALQCLSEMHREGLSPDVVTFISILKACRITGSLHKGKQIHDEIASKGLLANNIALANSLVSMYTKCGELAAAQRVFDELPVRNTISWSALIAGYTQHGRAQEALNCFELMQTEGLSPDAVTFTCILKACASFRCVERGKQIHDDVVNRGLLHKDNVLGNALVDMYAKCGMLPKAEELLKELPARNVVSWNTLIAGYSQQDRGYEALDCFERMQKEGISANGVTFSCTLKACGHIKAIDKGITIHDEIVKMGLLIEDIVLGNALVDMYAKCGMLPKARQVLSELPLRNVVSWNTLIAGYDQHEHGLESLNSFSQMQIEGFLPDAVTYVCSLRACGSIGATDKGKQIHTEIIDRRLLENSIILGNSLVYMYSKCGLLVKAEELLNNLPVRNEVSWNALIAGYAQQEQCHEALNCFERMQSEGLSPDAVTFTCILKACGNAGAINKGEKIHNDILIRSLLDTDVLVGNALVDMYAKCGVLVKAQEVHDGLPVRDIVSWNALISGYTQQGKGHEALACFELMQGEGISPDTTTFTCILKTSGFIGAIDTGKRIHDEIVNRGLLEKNVLLGNALVDMYAKCHEPGKAQEVLDELNLHTVVSWSALIEGYTLEGQGHEALKSFERMQTEGLFPDAVIFTCILKACGSTGAIAKGMQIHSEIVSTGSLEKDSEIGCALVDMYARCGVLEKAQEVLSKQPIQSVLSWNALIAGYGQSGQCQKALRSLDNMQREGFSPDGVTYASILKACGNVGAIDKGKQIHEEIVNKDLLETDVALSNALVEMYAKCGHLSKAQQLLYQIPVQDQSSWNTLIAAYVHREQAHEALNCFEQMQSEGHSPNEVTYVCVLKACGIIGAIDKGKEIHSEIVNNGMLQENIVLGTTLVDMYSKCGMLAKAVEVHGELLAKDTVSWNAMMAGYAQHGRGYEALNCFRRMQSEGVPPDATTLLCVLTACTHSGLLDVAHSYFRNMAMDYGIAPNLEIYCCMAAALGCAGHLDKAMSMIVEKMPTTTSSSSDPPLTWLVLLNCCRKWGNVRLGRLAFEHAIRLGPPDKEYVRPRGAYNHMARIYATADMHNDAGNVNESMENGQSSIPMKNNLWSYL